MVYITGDMHGDYSRFNDKKLRRLKKGDILLVCGDFGFIWNGEKKEKRIIKKIGRKKFLTLFIDGVNENFDLLGQYPVMNFAGGRVRKISGRLLYVCRGEVLNLCGRSFFCMGGGDNSDPDRISFATSAISEEEQQKALTSLEAARNEVDYVVSHDAPNSIKDFMELDIFSGGMLTKLLQDISESLKFRRWFFGRYHLDKHISVKMQAVFTGTYPLKDTKLAKKEHNVQRKEFEGLLTS